MTRHFPRALQATIDLSVLLVALTLAFLIRYDGAVPMPIMGRLFLMGPYIAVLEYFALVSLGIHRFSWRYVGLRETSRILIAWTFASVALLVARLVVGHLHGSMPYLEHGVIPLGVLAANFVLGFLGIVGVRVCRRLFGERLESVSRVKKDHPAKRTILVGAGQAGVLVARELVSRPDLAMRAVGFLDDDPRKVGALIHGIAVLGPSAELPAICAKLGVEQAIITMTNAPGSAIRRIKKLCERADIPVKIVPGLYEIVGGQVNLSRIRDIAIDDLLRREPVELDAAGIASYLQDKVVLVTGAGGSIGSELCRQVCRFSPQTVVLVERAENNLFNIHRELIAEHPEQKIVPCIADITDAARMRAILSELRPSIILHAAAHKHVPMMEWNPGEAVKNNVLGTKAVADLAAEFGVQVFVMISTDKAVNPTSVMGATKRAAEVYVQSLSGRSKTRFVTVRFGNVLGSAGSVIPIFQEQIARGGPVTVTDPEMRRYFMTIPEACQLVLQAGALGQGGEIFILDMGEPVKIVDLAKDLIALSGLAEGEDIELTFTGLRPGEKLFEELATDAERAQKTNHPKIFVGRLEPCAWEVARTRVANLSDAIEGGNLAATLSALRAIVPEYRTVSVRPDVPEFEEERSTAIPVPVTAH